MLEVLRSNKGFLRPEQWVQYGLSHDFRGVQAEELKECPDCNCKSSDVIGQYVYYSTLLSLRECAQCGLVFADKRIDPQVIQSHFEGVYKDDAYFLERRRRIFEQISALAARAAVHGGSVLDVGGAKGHLLATLQKRRPDLRLVVNDLSKEACDYAASEYGFHTVCGDVGTLETRSSRFDVIIMSDVIYYVPALREFWKIVPRLLAENGVLIIRVPNRLPLIRFWQALMHSIGGRANVEMQDHVRYFNSEQMYVFSRRYLLARLKGLGFTQVTAIPSDLLVRNRVDFWHPSYFYICRVVSMISFGKLILTPSMLVLAKGHNSGCDAHHATTR